MVTVEQAGVDTWKPVWYLDPDSRDAAELSAAATVKVARGQLLPNPIEGHRIGWMPAQGLLYAEGHPGGERLGSPDELPAALAQLVDAMRADGVPVPEGETRDVWDGALHRPGDRLAGVRESGFAGVARLDSTVDVACEDAAVGLALMAGIAAVARDMPRTKANVWWDPQGRVQTVALHGHGGGKLLGRIYDKGAESGTAPRGRLLRPEDQRRWGRGDRRGIEELTGSYVRDRFRARFAPLWQASRGVTVAGPVVLAGKLAEAVEAGELTRAAARNLAGDMLLDLAESAAVKPSRRTKFRHRALMREHGLVIADGVLQEVEVDVADVLGQALETDAWARRG